MKNFSHKSNNYSKAEVSKRVLEIKNRLKTEQQSQSGFTFDKLSLLVDDLITFPLGEFLVMNQGLDGYWTDYVVNYPRDKLHLLSNLERGLLLSRASMATYQRQQIFKIENQEKVCNGNHIATIPSGVMSEVLDLDYSQINDIKITGIDLDETAFVHAHNKYPELYKKYKINNECKNAFELDKIEEFDLISSNGLTIYIEDNELVQKLFDKFYMALKQGGKLVTSFLTYPLIFGDKSEQVPVLQTKKQRIQIAILIDILQVKWNAFRTTPQMQTLLSNSGFKDIRIIADENYVFPTIIAYKNI